MIRSGNIGRRTYLENWPSTSLSTIITYAIIPNTTQFIIMLYKTNMRF